MKNVFKFPFLIFSTVLMLALQFSCSTDDSQNIELVNQYYNALMSGDSSIANTILSGNFVKINNGKPEEPIGPKVLHKSIRNHQRRNSEYAYIIEEIFADGDFVAVRWRWNSINIKTGSPRKMDIPGLAIFRINSNRIEKQWQSFDMAMFNKQLLGDYQ